MALKIVTLIGLLTTASRYVGRPHANWLPCLLCNLDATNHAARALPMVLLMR